MSFFFLLTGLFAAPITEAHHENVITQYPVANSSVYLLKAQYDTVRIDNTDTASKIKKIKQLIEQTEKQPSAEFSALRGAMLAYEASLEGGLRGLSLAKEARKTLETSISQEENVLQGYALLCLGALYYRVPSWPVGFRDIKQAETLFLKAIRYNPKTLDPYVFYAEFLSSQNRYPAAIQQLKKGLELPPPHTALTAYGARKHEAQSLLKKLETQHP